MNVQGLDYNTQRPALIMPEYGREIQKMVEHSITLPTKEERQFCAQSIIKLMMAKTSQIASDENAQQAAWDHLFIMSKGKLDIEWPYDMSNAENISGKPEPIRLLTKEDHVRVRRYGHLLEELFEKLKTMPEGEERDELVRITANQMKRNLVLWGQGSSEDERVFADIATFTGGKIILNETNFTFDTINLSDADRELVAKKKKKK